MRVEIVTEAVGERANSASIAVSLDEHQRADRCGGSHAEWDA
jgi:hypothetical protein